METHECSACGTENSGAARYCEACGLVLAHGDVRRVGEEPRTSFLAGRYQLVRFLGEGANKSVYHAHDSLLQRDVALALLKTQGWGFWKSYPAGTERILQEARFMAQLGDHPNIVSVYDAGVEAGQTYLISQLMTGGDLESILAHAPQQRLSLQRALDLADEILAGLVWAHRHDIIHRDLKPANVWIDPDGTAKIGDFGLAVGVDRTTLSTKAAIVGTIAYMAPEQATGRMPDERSDLYSAGAILYAALTGRPPFVAADGAALIDMHVRARPLAPSYHNPAVPPPVERFVLRLLAKDPELRPRDAAAARQELAALRRAGGVGLGAAGGGEGARPGEEAHGAESFVGRSTELQRIRRALEEAFAGSARCVLVSGEPGIGKTALVERAAGQARLLGAEVLWGRNRESVETPYYMWSKIVAGVLQIVDPGEMRRVLGLRYGDLALVMPELGELGTPIPPAPSLAPEQRPQRLMDSVLGALTTAAERCPLVVVLEDVQWADAASLRLLERVGSAETDARLIFFVTFRDTEFGDAGSWPAGRPPAGPGVVRVGLSGLGREEVFDLLAALAGWEPEPVLVSRLLRATNGNPLMLGELAKLAVREGLALDEESLSEHLPLEVHDLLDRRLGQVSPDARALLAVAAAVGPRFPVALVAEVAELDEDRTWGLLRECLRVRLVTTSDDPGGRVGPRPTQLGFVHSLLQAQAYAELPGEERPRLHARIARALERAEHRGARGFPGIRSADVARHYLLAGGEVALEETVAHVLAAGEEALDSYAFEDAAGLFRRGLSACAPPAEEGEDGRAPEPCAPLLEGLGDALVGLTQRREATECYRRALSLDVDSSPVAAEDAGFPRISRCTVLEKLAWAELVDRRFPEALAALEEAEDGLAASCGEGSHEYWSQWIHIQLARAEAFYHAGDLERLALLVGRVGPTIEEHGTTDQRGDLLGARVRLGLRVGRYRPREWTVATARAELSLRSTGKSSYAGLGAAHFRLGFSLLLSGATEEAQRNLEAALSLSERIGDQIQVVRCLAYLAMLHRMRGELDPAERRARAAAEQAATVGQPGYAAAGRATVAWSLLRRGHSLEAREIAARCLDDWGPRVWPFEWLARWPLVEVALQQDRPDEAAVHLGALLDPSQQALPPELERAVENAVGAEGADREETLYRSLAVARRLGYA